MYRVRALDWTPWGRNDESKLTDSVWLSVAHFGSLGLHVSELVWLCMLGDGGRILCVSLKHREENTIGNEWDARMELGRAKRERKKKKMKNSWGCQEEQRLFLNHHEMKYNCSVEFILHPLYTLHPPETVQPASFLLLCPPSVFILYRVKRLVSWSSPPLCRNSQCEESKDWLFLQDILSRESFPEGGCATDLATPAVPTASRTGYTSCTASIQDLATPAVPTASSRKRFHLEKGVIHMFIVKDKELVIIIAFKFKI